MLFGSYYFISSKKIIHERQLYTYLALLGDYGGLTGLITVIVAFLSFEISHEFVMGSLLKEMYYIKGGKYEFNPLKLSNL